jgi:hypothetical protein
VSVSASVSLSESVSLSASVSVSVSGICVSEVSIAESSGCGQPYRDIANGTNASLLSNPFITTYRTLEFIKFVVYYYLVIKDIEKTIKRSST